MDSTPELKHKYIKRTGSSGNYQYWYLDSKNKKLFRGTVPKKLNKGRKDRIQEAITKARAELSISDKNIINENIIKIDHGKDSYGINSKDGVFTDKRKELHEKIIASFDKKGTSGKEAFIFAGLPGSGKTSSLKKYIKGVNAIEINSDDIKTKLDIDGHKYNGRNAGLLHRESSVIAKEMVDRHTKVGNTIIIDQTLRNKKKTESYIKMLKDRGYKVHLMATFVETETAIKRASSRFKKSGRFVPYKFISEIGDDVKANSFKLRNEVDSYTFVDNDGDITAGGKPFRLEGAWWKTTSLKR